MKVIVINSSVLLGQMRFSNSNLIALVISDRFLSIFFYKNSLLHRKFGPAEILINMNYKQQKLKYFWYKGSFIGGLKISKKWNVFYKELCRQDKLKVFK